MITTGHGRRSRIAVLRRDLAQVFQTGTLVCYPSALNHAASHKAGIRFRRSSLDDGCGADYLVTPAFWPATGPE
jgi:hypothetical protein